MDSEKKNPTSITPGANNPENTSKSNKKTIRGEDRPFLSKVSGIAKKTGAAITDAVSSASAFFARTFTKGENAKNEVHLADKDAVQAPRPVLASESVGFLLVPEEEYSEMSETAEANAPEFTEYFDGELSYADRRRIFALENASKPEKLDFSSSAAESTHDAYDPEFDDLHVTRPREHLPAEKQEFKERFKKSMNIFWKIWTYVRIPIIIAATCLILYFAGSKALNKINRSFLQPVDANDSTPVVVTIPTGSGASEIAKILYEACGEGQKGLISHKAVFKVYVDFIGKSSRLQAGTYVLSKNMSIPDIVDTICRGMPPREVRKMQIAEGMTIESIAAKLVADGILQTPDRFLELCRTGESFIDDHPFINDIPDDPTGERPYKLEGFLFPATYDIYVDANEETIIDKMLLRFEQIYGPKYTARTKELGLTMYDIVILASAIEKEAKLKVDPNNDFRKVAAVFYNRIERNMNLASDATIEYVLKTGSLHLTDDQLATQSGYNTHLNSGLPIGPVSNPGDAALNAALYPNAEYITDGYLFFCLMNPDNGALVFAKTLEEHNANVAKYSPRW
ncbi:MAG: endolytic transglycosylase MltG [Clostridia bacterium]|nr:endolytic transglycosylase MltG [Clostridia bacterium]